MKYKLLRGLVVDREWKEPGSIISAHGRYAELIVRAGAAEPVDDHEQAAQAAPPAVETATAPAHESSEKAVGPRHAGGKR
jgi:hypothetical protein